MIGRITLLWVGLAAGVATGLFQIKYEVQALEGKLTRINRAVLADQQAIHVLKAEWSYLNQPSELDKRAAENLELKPMAATQIGFVTDLPLRRTDEMLAQAPQAVPPSQIATLKGPPMAVASRPAPEAHPAVAHPAVARPVVAAVPPSNPAVTGYVLANPMLASVKQRQ